MRAFLLASVLAAAARANTFAGVIKGGTASLVYIGKFAFGYSTAGADVGFVNVSLVTSTPGLGVYLFDDQPESWPAVQDANLDCNAALEPFQGGTRYRASATVPQVQQTFYWNEPVTEMTHPRYWFLALAVKGCNSAVTETTYVVEFQQEDGTRLSNDEEPLPGLHLAFALLWLLLIGVLAYFVQVEQDWQPVQLKWLTWPASLELVSHLMLTVHWYVKASDGVGVVPAEALGRACHEVGIMLLWCILVTTAGGAGVSRKQVMAAGDRASVVGLLAVVGMAVMELVMVLWYEVGRQPSSNQYVLDSGVGVVVVVLQALLGVWFLASARWTYLSVTESLKPWMQRFMLAGSPAFVLLPVVAIVAAIVPAYDRLGALETTAACLYALLFLVILVVFLPHLWGSELEELYRADGLLDGAVDEIVMSRGGDDGVTFSNLPTGEDADKLLSGTV